MNEAWPKVRLGELLKPAGERTAVDAQGEYPNFGVFSFGRGVFRKPPISGSTSSATSLYRARTGQFVYSRLFAFEGAYAIVPPSCDGGYVSNEFPLFDCHPDHLDPAFLRWCFRQPLVWREAGVGSTGMGHRRQRVQPETLLEYAIPLPPLAEQRRIVARLDALAAKIEEAKGLCHAAEQSSAAILPAVRNEQFRRLHTKHPAQRLEDVADTRLGKMLSQAAKTGIGTAPYLRNANVQWDALDLSNVFSMDFNAEEIEEFRLRRGDILVCEGGDIGKAAIWNDQLPVCCFQKALHRIRLNPDTAMPRFMLHQIIWSAEQGQFADVKTQTTIAHLTGVKLRAHLVVVPPLPEQQAVVSTLDGLQARCEQAEADAGRRATEVDALLPSLLNRAFAGAL